MLSLNYMYMYMYIHNTLVLNTSYLANLVTESKIAKLYS